MIYFLPTEQQRNQATLWFQSLQKNICNVFEAIETELQTEKLIDKPAGKFQIQPWDRSETSVQNKDLHGGGIMAIMRGRVFEKVGVNFSNVYGEFSPEFAKQIPEADKNPAFWASGISLVAHMQSPVVPAVHMNTRHIITQNHGLVAVLI